VGGTVSEGAVSELAADEAAATTAFDVGEAELVVSVADSLPQAARSRLAAARHVIRSLVFIASECYTSSRVVWAF
jgi:hypothetical protein